MKPHVFIFTTIAVLFFVALPVFASTVTNNVNVSSNGSNANSSVSVNNTSDSSTTTTSSSSNNCHSVVTVNGKTYTSNNCGSLNVKDDNGNTSVNINGSSISSYDTITVTPGVTKTVEQHKKVKNQISNHEEHQNAWITFFQNQFEALKQFFSHL